MPPTRWRSVSLAKERLAATWLPGTSTNSVRTYALLKTNDPEVQDYLQKSMGKTSVAISETQKKLEEMLDSPEEMALSADIKKKRAEYIELRSTLLKLKAEGKHDEAMPHHQGQAGADARQLRRQHPRHAGAPTSTDRQVGRCDRRALPLGPHQPVGAALRSRWRSDRCWPGC